MLGLLDEEPNQVYSRGVHEYRVDNAIVCLPLFISTSIQICTAHLIPQERGSHR